jgi:outer membrane lipoprotein-sorting protein
MEMLVPKTLAPCVPKTLPLRVPNTMMRLLALLTALAVPLLADPLSDIFAKLDKAAASFKGMTANVVQTVHTAVVNDDSIENGNVKLKRAKPGDTRILLEFTNPDPKIVALEGDQGRYYRPKEKVVQVYDLSSRRNIVQQGLLLGFGSTSDEIKKSYEPSWVGTETLNGQPTAHIKLVPKSAEVLQSIKQADLWLSQDTGTPVQQRIFTSGGGDYTQLAYSAVKLNPPLSDKDLRLSLPKGVQTQQVGK